ncbi:MAG TPA: hypothetical protein VFR67_05975 [Pilimelia sp.]|nr:hypothetical protein [Pilimelia sp.]
MPTYAQLRDEPWWDRETTTAEMDWLGDELCRRTGRPRAAAGVKGDNRHLRGSHRSQEWILRSVYCTNRTYTVQSGLTAEQARHVAGFDFTPGSAGEMVAQCKRLYAAMRAGRLDEVREMYGNVDGDQVVDGWDNVRNRAASSDSSHLWHWHLSIDRRHCADRSLMERIVAIALGEDDDMTPEQLASADIWTNPYGDAPSNPKITLDTFVRNVGGDARSALAEARAARAEIALLRTEVARISGSDVDEQALAAALAPAIVAAVRDELGDVDAQELTAAVESGVRRVLGSLDAPPPA